MNTSVRRERFHLAGKTRGKARWPLPVFILMVLCRDVKVYIPGSARNRDFFSSRWSVLRTAPQSLTIFRQAIRSFSSRKQAMIAFLSGKILEKHPASVVIDVGGVGYDVAIPLSTFYELGEPGATCSSASTRSSARTDPTLRLSPARTRAFPEIDRRSGLRGKERHLDAFRNGARDHLRHSCRKNRAADLDPRRRPQDRRAADRRASRQGRRDRRRPPPVPGRLPPDARRRCGRR